MAHIHRRQLLIAAGALAFPAIGRGAEGKAEPVVVETSAGRIQGQRLNGVDAFKGVPYGASVSGAARFKPAKAALPWSGVRDATRLGTPALQLPSTVYGVNEPAPGEDCLVLNVWAPSDKGSGRPVMVYSHGGGFTTGSGGSSAQDGSVLAREHDVVVVATNHRLGILGYLSLAELGGADYAGSGNQGLSDIVLALKWVRENIAIFGGDPGNVTIFGESGGGAKTACLYAAPSVAPLFSKAIVQSGPAVRIGSAETAAATTRLFLAELGLQAADWRKLHEVSAADIFRAQQSLAGKTRNPSLGGWRGIAEFGPGGYGPIIDGDLLPSHPFDPAAPAVAKDKPLIVGSMDEEAAFFAWQGKDTEAFSLDEAGLRRRIAQLAGDKTDAILAAYRADRPKADPTDLFLAIGTARSFGLGTRITAERKAIQGGAPVFHYNIAYRSNRKPDGVDRELGAMHAADIPLAFNTVASPDTLAGSRADRFAAARNVSGYFASFARTGRPGVAGQPVWPAYELATRKTLVLDVDCAVVADRFPAERRVWDKLDPPA